MIIVSQDKKEIVNFDSVISIKIYHDDEDNECLYEIYAVVEEPDDNYILLGIYETEERAKEVLEQITIAYANMEIIKIPCIRIEETLLAKEIKRNIVFEMPEK